MSTSQPLCTSQESLPAYLTLDLLLQAQLLLLVLVGTADLLLDAGQHNLTAHTPVGTMADERCQQKRAVITDSIKKLKSKPLRGTRNPGLSWEPSPGHLGSSSDRFSSAKTLELDKKVE